MNDSTLFGDVPEISSNLEATPLHIAALNGKKATIEILLRNASEDDCPFDINKGDKLQRTALTYSVFGDRLECAELLVRNAAVILQGDRDKRTPLHWAAYLGKPKFLDLFWRHMDARVEWNSRDLEGRSPLHYAAAQENPKCLRLLLKRVSTEKVNVLDNEKKSALHWSAYYGYLVHVKLLIKASAKTQLRDSHYNTMLHLAVANRSPDAVQIVRLLLRINEYLSTMKNFQGRTALHVAVATGNEELVRELGQASRSALNEQDNLSRSALHYAVLRDDLNVVRILISCGASSHVGDSSGATAMHYAVKTNNLSVAQYLVSHRTFEDSPDKQGRTALMWAASQNAADILRLLFTRPDRVDVHACDNDGMTALHFSCIAGDEDCVNLLMTMSADVSRPDKLGQTPLFKACQQGHLNIVKILVGDAKDAGSPRGADLAVRDNGADGGAMSGERVQTAPGTTNEETTEYHWDSDGCSSEEVMHHGNGGETRNRHARFDDGCGVVSENEKKSMRTLEDFRGCTPLHFAAHAGYATVCRRLMKNGLDPGKKDSRGRTALHGAALTGQTCCLDALLSASRAEVATKLANERDEDGYSALHWAAVNGHLETVKMLMMTYQAFPNFRLKATNLTALDLAITAERHDVTQFLIDHGALTIAGVQQVASDTIKRYIRAWIEKRKRKSVEPLLLKHREKISENVAAVNSQQAIMNGKPGAPGVKAGKNSGGKNSEQTFGKDEETESDRNFGRDEKPGYLCLEDQPNDSSPTVVQTTSADTKHDESATCLTSSPLHGPSNKHDLRLDGNDRFLPSTPRSRDPVSPKRVTESGGEIPLSSCYIEENSLLESCRLGNADIVDSLISAGTDVNVRDEESRTPLHIAALHGHEEICERLLEKGADVAKRDTRGEIALHCASRNGHAKCAEILLRRNAELVDCVDKNGESALHWAASNGHLETVTLLLEKYNASPNVRGETSHMTALDYAAMANHENVVRFLRERRGGMPSEVADVIEGNVRSQIPGVPRAPAARIVEETRSGLVTSKPDVDDVEGRSDGEKCEHGVVMEVSKKAQCADVELEETQPGLTHASSGSVQDGLTCARHLPSPPKDGDYWRVTNEGRQVNLLGRLITDNDKERVLKLRRDWERISLVRRKIQAAVTIQRCFRRFLERKGWRDASGKATEQISKQGERRLVSPQTEEDTRLISFRNLQIADVKCSPAESPNSDNSEKGMLAKGRTKRGYESCFPPLLQTLCCAPATVPISSSNSRASGNSRRILRELSSRSQMTTNEIVDQYWLCKQKTKSGRDLVAQTSVCSQHRSRKINDGIGKRLPRSHSLPENYQDGRRIISNKQNSPTRFRPGSVQYCASKSFLSRNDRYVLSRSLMTKQAYASPAAVSYNFALDTYHPLASRQGCKQPSFPFKTSTRVRPKSMKRGVNGWVHTNKVARAMVSSESSHSQ